MGCWISLIGIVPLPVLPLAGHHRELGVLGIVRRTGHIRVALLDVQAAAVELALEGLGARAGIAQVRARSWFLLPGDQPLVGPQVYARLLAASGDIIIPDFRGRQDYIQLVIEAGPEVISHNVETVQRLTPRIRSLNKYETSLDVVRYISSKGFISKSGIMLGLGETREEVLETMDDLRAAGCKVFTIGQYLQPTLRHHPVREYIHPEVFREYKKIGLEMGFRFVESSPLVRSSYHAERHINA